MHVSLSSSAFLLALAFLTPFTSARSYKVGLVAYDHVNYQGRNAAYNRVGNFRLGFNADSYTFRRSGDVNCCIAFCLDNRDVGFRCLNTDRPDSSSPFNKVSINCGGVPRTCNF